MSSSSFLFSCCKSGDFANLAAFLATAARHANANHTQQTGTANATASNRGHSVDLNPRDSQNWTPLMHAVSINSVPCVEELIRHGAQVNVKDDYGITPLIIAAAHCYYDMITFLVSCKANLLSSTTAGHTALMKAAMASHTHNILCCEYIIKEAKQRHAHAPLDSTAIDGRNAFHFAVESGNLSIVHYFLASQPALIDSTIKDGRSAMHLAAEDGDYMMIEELVAAGINTQIKDSQGRTAFEIRPKRISYQNIRGAVAVANTKAPAAQGKVVYSLPGSKPKAAAGSASSAINVLSRSQPPVSSVPSAVFTAATADELMSASEARQRIEKAVEAGKALKEKRDKEAKLADKRAERLRLDREERDRELLLDRQGQEEKSRINKQKMEEEEAQQAKEAEEARRIQLEQEALEYESMHPSVAAKFNYKRVNQLPPMPSGATRLAMPSVDAVVLQEKALAAAAAAAAAASSPANSAPSVDSPSSADADGGDGDGEGAPIEEDDDEEARAAFRKQFMENWMKQQQE